MAIAPPPIGTSARLSGRVCSNCVLMSTSSSSSQATCTVATIRMSAKMVTLPLSSRSSRSIRAIAWTANEKPMSPPNSLARASSPSNTPGRSVSGLERIAVLDGDLDLQDVFYEIAADGGGHTQMRARSPVCLIRGFPRRSGRGRRRTTTEGGSPCWMSPLKLHQKPAACGAAQGRPQLTVDFGTRRRTCRGPNQCARSGPSPRRNRSVDVDDERGLSVPLPAVTSTSKSRPSAVKCLKCVE